jgi:hypothetical protein
VVRQYRNRIEVLALNREVADQVLTEALHPLGLGHRELAANGNAVDSLVDPLFGRE